MNCAQVGYGAGDIGIIYKGPRFYQSGRGFGSAFASIWRFLRPVVSASLDTIKSEALKSGVGLIQDLQDNKPLKEALKSQGRVALSNLKDSAFQGLKNKMQSGGMYKRKRKRRTKLSAVQKKKRTQRKKSRCNKKSKKPRKTPHNKKRNSTRSLDIFS